MFPERVAEWLAIHRPVIDAIALLRREDAEQAAIDLLLNFQPVRLLRLSWELWPTLGFDETADPEELLVAVLPAPTIALCRFALWGEEPRDGWAALHLAG
jgi:hypothetical protein